MTGRPHLVCCCTWQSPLLARPPATAPLRQIHLDSSKYITNIWEGETDKSLGKIYCGGLANLSNSKSKTFCKMSRHCLSDVWVASDVKCQLIFVNLRSANSSANKGQIRELLNWHHPSVSCFVFIFCVRFPLYRHLSYLEQGNENEDKRFAR